MAKSVIYLRCLYHFQQPINIITKPKNIRHETWQTKIIVPDEHNRTPTSKGVPETLQPKIGRNSSTRYALETRLLASLLTSHCSLRFHLMDLTDYDRCRFCQDTANKTILRLILMILFLMLV